MMILVFFLGHCVPLIIQFFFGKCLLIFLKSGTARHSRKTLDFCKFGLQALATAHSPPCTPLMWSYVTSSKFWSLIFFAVHRIIRRSWFFFGPLCSPNHTVFFRQMSSNFFLKSGPARHSRKTLDVRRSIWMCCTSKSTLLRSIVPGWRWSRTRGQHCLKPPHGMTWLETGSMGSMAQSYCARWCDTQNPVRFPSIWWEVSFAIIPLACPNYSTSAAFQVHKKFPLQRHQNLTGTIAHYNLNALS